MLKLKLIKPITSATNWLLAIGFTPLFDFVNKYVFSDWVFFKWLTVVVALDFITGVTKAWSKRMDITSRGFRDTVMKLIQYGAFIIITHVMTHFEVGGKASIDFSWLNNVAYTFLILIEIKSVLENIIEIKDADGAFKEFIGKIVSQISTKTNTTDEK